MIVAPTHSTRRASTSGRNRYAGKKGDGSFRRYDVLDDKEQLKMPDRPV